MKTPLHIIRVSLLLLLSLLGDHRLENQEENFTIPFYLIAKLIMVEATAGEQKGLFIVDTGSPELVLNAVYFRRSKISSTIDALSGHTIQTKTAWVPFELGTLRMKSKQALLTDLTHLEKGRNIQILGVIGFSILKDFEILMDYGARKLSFYQLTKAGDRLITSEHDDRPALILPVDLRGHFPCLEIQVGSAELYIAIDSGAGLNVLDTKTSRDLANYYRTPQEANVKSFSLEDTRAELVQLDSVYLEGIEFPPMLAIFASLKPLNDQTTGRKSRRYLAMNSCGTTRSPSITAKVNCRSGRRRLQILQ